VIRKNSNVFLNLLTLMIVCDLEELDQKAIDWMKSALFLDVSQEEAAVMFKNKINQAKDCGPYTAWRPFDNICHILSDRKKEEKLLKRKKKTDEIERQRQAAEETRVPQRQQA